MKFKCVLGWIATVLVVFGTGFAIAAPEISQIQDGFEHGAQIVAFGNNFGTKVPAAPLRYDNFENGTVGEKLPGQSQGGWYTINDSDTGWAAPRYNNDRARVSDETVVICDYSNSYNATIGLWGIDTSDLYFSGWCYRDDYAGTALNSDNRKLTGNFGKSSGGTYGNPQARIGTDGAGHYYEHHYMSDNNGSSIASDYYTPSGDVWDNWFRLERFMHQGEVGSSDGKTWVAHNLNLDSELSGNLHPNGSDFDYFLLGHYFRKINDATLKMYWGELYVDITQARIEIGNEPIFGDCTHREIQIPTSWSPNSVEFTANIGTFDGSSDTYLFVIDSNGQPSEGKLISFGDLPPPPEGPGQPGQPILN